jgi:hypothetical protein
LPLRLWQSLPSPNQDVRRTSESARAIISNQKVTKSKLGDNDAGKPYTQLHRTCKLLRSGRLMAKAFLVAVGSVSNKYEIGEPVEGREGGEVKGKMRRKEKGVSRVYGGRECEGDRKHLSSWNLARTANIMREFCATCGNCRVFFFTSTCRCECVVRAAAASPRPCWHWDDAASLEVP